MKYWLLKTEPITFSLDDLKKSENKTTAWEGVRNYQARNYLKEMKIGDFAFFYHSVIKPTSIVGIVKVVKTAYSDITQFDPESKYYEKNTSIENPRWVVVDVKFEKEFKKPITLDELKGINGLEEMFLLRKGSRLSVQPVTKSEWDIITSL